MHRSPPPPPSTAPSTSTGSKPNDSAQSAHHHQAHHIEEFGQVHNVQHRDADSQHSDAAPPPLRSRDALTRRNLGRKVLAALFERRHLQQYYASEVLYRTAQRRTVAPDELFLDLVLVGGIAALGHELRENFHSWKDVEKFFLLFAAIYSSWRTVILLWNLWGIKKDLFEKLVIYAVFTCLIGIALGAHGAFQDGIRPIAISLPYLAAAFVRSERATRILYWIPLGLQFVAIFFTGSVYRFLHRNRPGSTRLAVAIELMVEKYEVLTMIVLGESVLGILFEAGKFLTKEGAQLDRLYGVAAASTAMLYCLQTLYVNVDGCIVKGGQHAIRYKVVFGIVWSQLHTLYHMALILFATGLGISIHDVMLPSEKSESARWAVVVVMRAATGGKGAVAPGFGDKERWLFSVGWGMSMIMSAAMGVLHYGGPRAASRRYRVATRVVVATGVMVGLPFTRLRADVYLGVHTAVVVLLTVAEFILAHMDRMGFFRSEGSSKASSGWGVSFDDGEGGESADAPSRPEEVQLQGGGDMPEELSLALRRRLCRGHCSRLVAVRRAVSGGDGGDAAV
ncbi:hypothetical protein BWQ96_09197 [Gracilariopsis chorda]|uniref:Uncharacterized protein n=1 Tax=Gracilariopsis chorda TaxID=448386 RepID=A0A2V3IGE6_9FLOR|nr:hypothetical protein BWQ96_09197 [Gracilariopsis chorda]|eukprot:PXF41093.1 hypothetical protein BWQ96_09197 [Gracilariopsis chorda]